MPNFPRLKTGAVMQYPAPREIRFATEVVRFLDGTEQRYREFRGPLRRWIIQLDLLDEAELAALDGFFVETQGGFGSFSFTDPGDGCEYANCSLDQDSLELTSTGEMRGSVTLAIRENRT